MQRMVSRIMLSRFPFYGHMPILDTEKGMKTMILLVAEVLHDFDVLDAAVGRKHLHAGHRG